MNQAEPWRPFHDEKSGKAWVVASSTYKDNPHIDQVEYERQLKSACPHDPELLRAWLEGDWNISRGAFFAGVLGDHNMVEPWSRSPGFLVTDELVHLLPAKRAALERANRWEIYLAHDYGSSAPSVTYLCAKSPGAEGPDGRWYPRDSIVLVDELATNVPGQLIEGMGHTINHVAELITEFAKRWGIPQPKGVADDSIFSHHGHGAGSIADEFRRCGVRFLPARKGGRLWGWERMRRLLQDAGKPDVAGLYVSRSCEYFWATCPALARDPRNPADIDTRQADHAADAARYALTYERPAVKLVRLSGW